MVDRAAVMQAVRRPESAAIAGIVFAVILGAVIVRLKDAVPELPSELGAWSEDAGRRDAVGLALNLMPFAGIAFLWFIAVIRAQVGSTEDRFIETVFLGSGLIFVALLFAAAAALKAVLTLHESGIEMPAEGRAYGWALASALLGTFGTRMAAVFIATVATSGRRSGALPAWIAVSGYAVALALLLTPPLPTVVQFLFPAWVLVLSGYLLTGAAARRAERRVTSVQ
jgi:hypothetical protein